MQSPSLDASRVGEWAGTRSDLPTTDRRWRGAQLDWSGCDKLSRALSCAAVWRVLLSTTWSCSQLMRSTHLHPASGAVAGTCEAATAADSGATGTRRTVSKRDVSPILVTVWSIPVRRLDSVCSLGSGRPPPPRRLSQTAEKVRSNLTSPRRVVLASHRVATFLCHHRGETPVGTPQPSL